MAASGRRMYVYIIMLIRYFMRSLNKNILNLDRRQVKVGDILFARIIFIDYATKNVRLSCRPHIVDMAAPTLPALGETVSDLKVVAVYKNLGILLANISETAESTSVVEDAAEKAEEGGEDGAAGEISVTAQSGKKKSAAAALRLAKKADLAVVKVFIHKSSLAKSPSFESAEDDESEEKVWQ